MTSVNRRLHSLTCAYHRGSSLPYIVRHSFSTARIPIYTASAQFIVRFALSSLMLDASLL